jgi:hypothetical protein
VVGQLLLEFFHLLLDLVDDLIDASVQLTRRIGSLEIPLELRRHDDVDSRSVRFFQLDGDVDSADSLNEPTQFLDFINDFLLGGIRKIAMAGRNVDLHSRLLLNFEVRNR